MKISVIIPTYNRRALIGAAINSALWQEGVSTEVIVVDDGSTDDTVAWLADIYAQQPLRVMHNARMHGPAGARNTGILSATGDLIAFLDSDDIFLPGHLASSAAALTRFPEVGLVFGLALYELDGQPVDYMGPNFERKLALAPTRYSDAELSVFTDAYFDHLLECGCYFNLSTVVLRSSAARTLMREELRIAEDFEMWVRLSRNYRFACLHRPQIRYVLHKQNVSFETVGGTADHAPELLAAYEIMLRYPDLSPAQIFTIRRQMATVLFSWGYRCRLAGDLGAAASLYLRSLRLGLRRKSALALGKLAVLALTTRRAS